MRDAANRLRDYRLEHGLSQSDLADAIGPTANQRSIANWELKRKRPSLANSAAIERVTGIRGIDWLKIRLVDVPPERRRARAA
jgi:transcriptional regulator with XRE-family HTH domain